MVAIAGRREGVRVYALEDVRKAVEWRVEVEVEREKEKALRDASSKKSPPDQKAGRHVLEASKGSSSTDISVPSSPINLKKSHTLENGRPDPQNSNIMSVSPPPLYANLDTTNHRVTSLPSNPSSPVTPLAPRRDRGASVSTIVGPTKLTDEGRQGGEKAEWMDDRESDDEALDPVAAGSSGSAALDERTSAAAPSLDLSIAVQPSNLATRRLSSSALGTSITRRTRPANLDLPSTIIAEFAPRPPASPAPTLQSMRQALNYPAPTLVPRPARAYARAEDSGVDTPVEGRDYISFAQALRESRLPVPSVPQLPILPPVRPTPQRAATMSSDMAARPASQTANLNSSDQSLQIVDRPESPPSSFPGSSTDRRRRRWSLLDGVLRPSSAPIGSPTTSEAHSLLPTSQSTTDINSPTTFSNGDGSSTLVARSLGRMAGSAQASTTSLNRIPQTVDRIFQPQTNPSAPPISPIQSSSSPPFSSTPPSSPSRNDPLLPRPRGAHRFLPKLLTALGTSSRHHQSQSHDDPQAKKGLTAMASKNSSSSEKKAPNGVNVVLQAPAPRLEYVKLPGTKSALAIKAVETPKKR